MTFERRDIDVGELAAILERAGAGALSPAERDKLKVALDTLAFLTHEIGAKGASIGRLRRMLFGASTEKTNKIFPDPPAGDGAATSSPGGRSATDASGTSRPRRPGHGRNGAASYPGATLVCITHGTLHAGERCPQCLKGKLYAQPQPAVLVRIRGMAPLGATLYELERLRCSLCGEVFTAQAPDGVGTEKYDPSAPAMIALLKYGCGLPFHRIEKLQRNLGIPLPAATQWELVDHAARAIRPAHQELIRQAAQGEIVHNDDTTMKLLAFGTSPFSEDEPSETRTGVYTPPASSRARGRTTSRCTSPAASTPAKTWPGSSPSGPPRCPRPFRCAMRWRTTRPGSSSPSSPTASRMPAGSSSRSRQAFPTSAVTCWRPCARSTATTPRPARSSWRPMHASPSTRSTAVH